MKRILICGAVAAMAMGCNLLDQKKPEKEPPVQLMNQQTDNAEVAAAAKADRLGRALAMLDVMNREERDIAQLAVDRAASKDVKDMAGTLATEHAADVTSLQRLIEDRKLSLAEARNDPMYKAYSASIAKTRGKLDSLKGTAFDVAFLDHQPPAHALMRELARQAKELTDDAPLGSFLSSIGDHAKAQEARAYAAISPACGGKAVAREPADTDTEASYVPPPPEDEETTPTNPYE